MKRLYYTILLLISIVIMSNQKLNAKESNKSKIFIGIVNPFLKNSNAYTLFYHKQFIFEFLSRFSSNTIEIKILSVEKADDNNIYLENSKLSAIIQGCDYLIYSKISTIATQIFFSINLLNPSNNEIIISKTFIQKSDYTITEALSNNTENIINLIANTTLTKTKIKTSKQQKSKDTFEETKYDYKHGFFILNGFFKNHPNVQSFLNWYIGYNFSPYNFFRIEAAFFWGAGNLDPAFNIQLTSIDTFFFGGYNAIYFYFANIFEPSFGARIEFSNVVGAHAYLSIPAEISFRLYLKGGNAIRFSTSFQFVCFDFNTLEWENKYTIGFMIGYEKKL